MHSSETSSSVTLLGAHRWDVLYHVNVSPILISLAVSCRRVTGPVDVYRFMWPIREVEHEPSASKFCILLSSYVGAIVGRSGGTEGWTAVWEVYQYSRPFSLLPAFPMVGVAGLYSSWLLRSS